MTAQEIRYLGQGCRQARKHGLFQEFREHYRSYRGMGDSVKEAAWKFLYDWDLLEMVTVIDEGVVLGLSAKEEVSFRSDLNEGLKPPGKTWPGVLKVNYPWVDINTTLRGAFCMDVQVEGKETPYRYWFGRPGNVRWRTREDSV